MRIYIADEGDTFRKIAKQFDMEIEELLHQNPAITSPNQNVGSLQVKLPSADQSFDVQMCLTFMIFSAAL